ncbi:MAG: hypothetical protein ACOC1K_07235 [Nanoarchaeota archaeon]
MKKRNFYLVFVLLILFLASCASSRHSGRKNLRGACPAYQELTR